MKVLRSFSVAITLVVLASCSSPTPMPSLPGVAPMDQVDAHKKSYETLKAARVVVKVQSCISGTGAATFSASGKAKGRVRGKFRLTGTWNFFNVGGESYWTFAESFEIKGKHPTDGIVTGSGTDSIATCKTFGPVNGGKELTYKLRLRSGAATTTLLKNGAALLQRLH